MSELILYNYPLSPYSEKIRLMLGYSGLPWQSVTVAAMPPRPELALLAGGYRRIPVAQIGADVYCDTRTIAAEIARLSSRPELDIANCSADAQAFAQHADTSVFLAIFGSGGTGLLQRLARDTGLRNTLRFIGDRLGIARRSRVKAVVGKAAGAVVAAHIQDMEQRLSADFLFGEAPCAADFSAAFGLWFADLTAAKLLSDAPRVTAWYERMQAFGHGKLTPLTADAALELARDTVPAELPETDRLEPRPVRIAPGDYARDPTAGLLVAEGADRWVLQRTHARIGNVHVHFPKTGFSLRELAT